MKTFNKISISIFTALVLIITGCGKYEDGPAFSIHTKKNRVAGDWVVESYTVNGTDYTSDYNTAVGANFVLKIEKDGGYSTEGNFPDTGTWELGEDKDDIRFLSSASGSTEQSFRILRLKTKELWLRQTQANGDEWIIKYKAEKD